MSKKQEKSIYTARTSYTDRSAMEKNSFSELNVKIMTLDTALLLLDSEEETVLIAVFQHINTFMRKQIENIEIIKEKNMLDLLLAKQFFINQENPIVRRFALFITTTIIESLNPLLDLETEKTLEIIDICVQFYLKDSDGFVLEYLSVIINKCLSDPIMTSRVLDYIEYIDKYLVIVGRTDNPDIMLHSLETMHKMLQVQDTLSVHAYVANPLFSVQRITCELNNEFTEIRSAALKVIKDLIPDTSEEGAFALENQAIFVLQQLTKIFCDVAMVENAPEAVEVLTTAMRSERMAQLFFEHSLFNKIIENVRANAETLTMEFKCKATSIFSESAKHSQLLVRLCNANVTELFLNCLLTTEQPPGSHVLTGLNRVLSMSDCAKAIIDAYPDGVIAKLIRLIQDPEMDIKIREQSAEFLFNLLIYSFHCTAEYLMALSFPEVLAGVFSQGFEKLSIDLIISLLRIIESLAQQTDYRFQLGQAPEFTKYLALLLRNSFTAAIVVTNIFRCLCTLIDEDEVRPCLIKYFTIFSIKRALKSISQVVNTAVTNFIMQTTRFPEFLNEYIDNGVLEILMLHQKFSYTITTWNPAIESILSKTATIKFAIRNNLGFTDTTAGSNFFVSKVRLDDFRDFLRILKEDVSPLHPVLLVNFEYAETPEELVTEVPNECFLPGEETDTGWCYCRQPGDLNLPRYLDELNAELESRGLHENPSRIQRCIDFENLSKRAKVVAEIVAGVLGEDLKKQDLNSPEDCCKHTVDCHLKQLSHQLHSTFIPIGLVRSGCRFERAILFKALADQIGLPCTLQRSVDGRFLFNEVPLPVEAEHDIHCDKKTMKLLPWRMLRPTHIVDLLYNVGELYHMQSREALQYLKLY